MGITTSNLLHEPDSLYVVEHKETFSLGDVCVHSSPAPYKSLEDNAVNEDAFLIQSLGPDSMLIAVADGVGGNVKGQDASALVIECLRTATSDCQLNGSQMRERILNAIELSNNELLAKGTGSATTLVVAVISENEVRPYHVGDSSLIVTGQRGLVKQRSICHSPVGFGLEAGFLDDQDALNHEQSHLLLNLIGSSDMRIEVGAPFQLARFDTLLLCTDGLTDNIVLQDVVDTIRNGALGNAMDSLVLQCNNRMNSTDGHQDDLTIALFRRNH